MPPQKSLKAGTYGHLISNTKLTIGGGFLKDILAEAARAMEIKLFFHCQLHSIAWTHVQMGTSQIYKNPNVDGIAEVWGSHY